MDWAKVRTDFPILDRTFHGRPFVYLDSAATSQKPRVVIDAVADFYGRLNANVHRGTYQLSEEATEAYESARGRLAKFVHAEDPSEIVFVRGTTEAINLVSTSLSQTVLKRGTRVLTTVMEHHSNIVPWQILRSRGGPELDFVDIDDNGELVRADYDRLLTPSTKLVTLTHVSNVLGTVNPVRAIADQAHAAGALVLLDAAQSVPHRAVDVRELGVDLIAFSGHKMLGPTGIGVLWGRRDLLEGMPPAMGGGEMIREVHQDRVAFREPPARFEAGTPNISGAVGLGVAAEYLERIGWDEIAAHEQSMQRRAAKRVSEGFDGRVTIVGPKEITNREAVISFSLEGVHAHDISSILDAHGVAIRSGHHCAQPLMERLGVAALSRASPYVYNSPDDIDRLFDALGEVVRVFRGHERVSAKAPLPDLSPAGRQAR
ncbi:MAG: SufS family cysteine desulfurase [Thermoplasmata archaeon]|nr:SufS family cysteine desulfurase [Thermoplasmata archaeon]MCI4358868.1 SufS family cysteine desulfurase [Thermoplasmata archaeon]